MRPMIQWLAVPLLLFALPGPSPAAPVPEEAACAVGAPSPATPLPLQCLLVRNMGTCVECCKDATGCGEQGPFPCNACSRFCKNFAPPGPESPPEP